MQRVDDASDHLPDKHDQVPEAQSDERLTRAEAVPARVSGESDEHGPIDQEDKLWLLCRESHQPHAQTHQQSVNMPRVRLSNVVFRQLLPKRAAAPQTAEHLHRVCSCSNYKVSLSYLTCFFDLF